MTIARDMTNCSLSEIFTYCKDHLLNQGTKCVSKYRTRNEELSNKIIKCCYRYNGLMCGAGPLISDEKYEEDMEGSLFPNINKDYNLGYSEEQIQLIVKIQKIHDTFDVQYWPVLLDFIKKTELAGL